MTTETEIPGDEPVMTGEILPEGHAEDAPLAPAPADAPAPVPQAAPEPAPEPEPEPQPEPKKLSKGLNQRFAELTAKAREEAAQREREAEARRVAEARAAAAEELIRKLGGEVPTSPAEKPPTADELRAQVREELQREEAARAFNTRCDEVFHAGQKAFPDFQESVANLNMLGVIRPDNPAFLTAVLETDAPEKVLHELAQDPEEAVRIARLDPVRQAAALVKMSVKLATPAAPKPKPVSAAPAPIEPIGGATDKGFDPLDETIPIDVWAEEMEKRDAAKRKRLAERGY